MTVDRSQTEPVEQGIQTDELLVNMGPQHPSTHGVLRLVLRTDGEIIIDVEPKIGYLHRSGEKIGESVTARQFLPYTDRLDYLASMNMNLGWSMVVEKLLGLKPTARVDCLRIIMCELNRIASHLVAAGSYGLDLGSFTPFTYTFREREKIQNLFEAVCGARLTYSYIVPGGVTADLPDGWLDQCEAFLVEFTPVIDELHAMLTVNDIFIRRTAGIGVMSAETAIAYGCTGPVLRGSGVDWDLRRDGQSPYVDLYRGYEFDVIAPINGHYRNEQAYPAVPRGAVVGDCWHRFYIRMIEVVQSMALVRQAMDRYRKSDPDLGKPIKTIEKLPVGEAYLETEAPKGQMGFLVIGDGTKTPRRVRLRSSCYSNLSVTALLCRGGLIADVPAVVGSLDIVLGEIDR